MNAYRALEEIGPTVYNKAVAELQERMQARVTLKNAEPQLRSATVQHVTGSWRLLKHARPMVATTTFQE